MEDEEAEDDNRPTDAMAVPPVPDLPPPGPAAPRSPFEPFELKRGTALGDYVIDGELGRGGMGVVYSATHPVIGKRVAIKVLRSSSNPAAVERFIQEARAVNQIGHPNIVDIFDFAELPDGRRYLIMDLLTGQTLRARIKQGRLHVAEACVVVDEVASALIAAHAIGFIHRDLKPDNVFLSQHGPRLDVKLLDFGLAKLLPSSSLADERAFRTATGVQLGTPDYMAPEQVRAAPDIDHRADIYALGVLAFEVLTSTRASRLAGARADLLGTPADVVGAVEGVPLELAQLVDAMVASDPNDRPSLVAVRAVIKRLRQDLPSLSSVALAMMPPAADGPSPGAEAATAILRRRAIAESDPTLERPVTHRPASQSSPPRRLAIPRTKLGVQPAAAAPRRTEPPARRPSRGVWWLVAIVVAVSLGAALALALS